MGRQYLSGVETHRVETRSGRLVDTAAEDIAVVKHDPARFRLFLVRRWIVADVIDPGAFTCGPGQHFLAEFLAGTVGERGDIQADARQIRRLYHDLRLSAGTENEDVDIALAKAGGFTLVHGIEGRRALGFVKVDRLGNHALASAAVPCCSARSLAGIQA